MLSVRPTKIVQTQAVTIILFGASQPLSTNSHRWTTAAERSGAGLVGILSRSLGGDTFVVDTNGLNAITWLDDGGHPHGDRMRLTERFRRRDFGHLDIEMTIDDPEFYTKPLDGHDPKRADRGRRVDRVHVRERERLRSPGGKVTSTAAGDGSG